MTGDFRDVRVSFKKQKIVIHPLTFTGYRCQRPRYILGARLVALDTTEKTRNFMIVNI